MDLSQSNEDNNNDNEIFKNIKTVMNMINENSNIVTVKNFFLMLSRKEQLLL
jgi:hypothetical protein